MEAEKYIGFIKYEGYLVEDGLMDARKQAEALIGFDTAIRYFINIQAPISRNFEFEIPVRVKQGSWEALIPATAIGWAQAGLGIALTAYLAKAAQKMAENDFENYGLKDLFKNSIDAIKWVIKIGKHLGNLTTKKFNNLKFSNDRSLVGIPNKDGLYLFVPKDILEIYAETNPHFLEKLAANIVEGRALTIGAIDDNYEDSVSIDFKDKEIFCEKDRDEEDEEFLFPDLLHGDEVILEGEVTRENKTSNSMGFKYQDHILTSYPKTGSIVRYKSMLFLKCRIHGTIDRTDEKNRHTARRPRIYFSHLVPLETENTYDLFN